MGKLKIYSVIFLMLLSITACGGSGGDTDTAPTGSSDWDSMVWDQDNWS